MEGRIGEFLTLLVNHYPQGLTRTEIKMLLAVNNNQSFMSLYRNGNIFIYIEKRYCDAAPARYTMLSLAEGVVTG